MLIPQLRYMVEPAKWYNYLNQSTCIAIEGVDDVAMFEELCQAMTVLDMPNDMQVSRRLKFSGLLM